MLTPLVEEINPVALEEVIPKKSLAEEDNRVPTPPTQEIIPATECAEEEDTMMYQYPKYQDDPDMEAHIRAFLETWEANHVSKRLTKAKAEGSKIVEFGLSLEGPAVQRHAKHLPGSFAPFQALREKFLWLFHRQVEQTKLVGQFYTMCQEANETVPQFII